MAKSSTAKELHQQHIEDNHIAMKTTKIHRLHFSIDINASKEKIWKALWSEDSYRQWAAIFFEGSYLRCDHWEEGGTVFFLSPDDSGIYSTIERHIPHQHIVFKHIGKVSKGQKQVADAESQTWSGATEMYSIADGMHHHTLHIEIDVLDEHKDFMMTTFPMALEKMKNLSEQP